MAIEVRTNTGVNESLTFDLASVFDEYHGNNQNNYLQHKARDVVCPSRWVRPLTQSESIVQEITVKEYLNNPIRQITCA